MKVFDLFAELSSENRLGILQTLDEKPMTFTSLIKEIDMNSTEASRQLSRLTEAWLIEKKGMEDIIIHPLENWFYPAYQI